MDEKTLLENISALDTVYQEETHSRFGYASKINSGDLAWSASYQLEAYYQLFRATGEVQYLKKIADCFEYALGSRTDNEGHTPLGWDHARYSVKKVTDPGFNKELDDAKEWEFSTDGAKILTEGDARVLELAPGASMSLTIDTYVPGAVYEFSADHLCGGMAVSVSDAETGEVIPNLWSEPEAWLPVVSDDGWNAVQNTMEKELGKRYRFVLPEDGAPVTLTIKNAGDTSAQIDNVQFAQAAQFLAHDMIFCAPAAKFVKTVYENEALGVLAFDETRTYREVAESFLAIIEPMVHKWDKDWKNIGDDKGIYYWPDDESGEAGFVLPHNQYLQMVQVMLPLYSATGNKEYLDRATRMLTFFKSNIRVKEQDGREFYHWNYMDRAFDTEEHKHDYTEDTSHGALDLGAIFTGIEYGVVFSEEDIPYLLNTVYQTLWNGSLTEPEIYRAIEFDGGPGWHQPIPSESYIRDWMYLGKWDRNITDAFTGYLSLNGDAAAKSGHPAKLLAYAYAYRVLHGDTALRVPENNFMDIADFAWAHAAITTLADKGVIRGTAVQQFSPMREITRADMTLMVMRAFSFPEQTDTQPFPDVKADAYYADAVLQARALGIVNGCGAAGFLPDQSITREEFMVILSRAIEKAEIVVNPDFFPVKLFSDWSEVSSYAEDAVREMEIIGVLRGTDGRIHPKAPITRAEAAVMLWRILTYSSI